MTDISSDAASAEDPAANAPTGAEAAARPAAGADDWLSVNRANWEDRSRVHAFSTFYDLPAFRAGRRQSTLRPFEPAELGDVAGKRLLHLQCHMGQDTLSWARRGAASVTGLDLSEHAVATAASLAADTGLADRARFVAADVYTAAEALAGELPYDVVYTGLGALVWLPDLDRWADTVARLLAPGGVLYLVEFHPFASVLDEDARTVARDYPEPGAQGVLQDFPYTYTDGPRLENTVSVQWEHPLGEVLTAIGRSGLRLEFLHEHDHTLFEMFPALEPSPPDGGYRFPPGYPRLPLMYSLRARRDATR